MGDIITVKEGAELRGVSVAVIRYWLRSGWLKSGRKSGGTWLIDKAELLSFEPPARGPRPKRGER